MPTSSAIEYGPADSNHPVATFSPCFSIHRKREALLLFVQSSGASVVGVQRQIARGIRNGRRWRLGALGIRFLCGTWPHCVFASKQDVYNPGNAIRARNALHCESEKIERTLCE